MGTEAWCLTGLWLKTVLFIIRMQPLLLWVPARVAIAKYYENPAVMTHILMALDHKDGLILGPMVAFRDRC